MKTVKFHKRDITSVIAYLKKGKVVAFPTDTVYGLGVIYDNEEALENLKKAKGRPEHKPIPTMVNSIEQIRQIAKLDEVGEQLAKAFMPGAFTMILPKQDHLAAYLTNGFDSVGIRMPDDAFLKSVMEGCGKPLLVSSANLSDSPCGKNTNEVLKQLDGRIDAIVVGEAKGGYASTIVDLTKTPLQVLREGPVTLEMINKVLNIKEVLK